PTGTAIGEYLFWVNGVTISSGTTTLFGGDTWGQGNGFNAGQDQKSPNMTLTMTDSSNNSAILFYWPTSYSVDGGMWGNLIPEQVPVNILGFADVFVTGSAAEVEFVPIDIVATPEPAPLALLAVGGAMALLRRKRKTA
ncbi:MAG TPA: PEP-CTERM sorting domain-containing protein, partial [Phycisphaerae bacterium]|nr:PEP-CTERM sorting domain-containing protein [Phycisphaerae bacterium]